ncbi:MAG: T9SS type A sorting domain-containing protein [Bacteroidia bacterium]|nr:T9SS type A sorting domain-containing protein [Bacteroidia bacterium]
MKLYKQTVFALVLLTALALPAAGQNLTQQREYKSTDLAYPVLSTSGDAQRNQEVYEQELRNYDARKRAIMQEMTAENAGVFSSDDVQRSNSVVTPQEITFTNCLIPRDASWTAVPRNDDGSLGPIALPFTFNLYGTGYTSVWINTNGNLTFTGPVGSFVPANMPVAIPMVAGFWADIDTRNTACGQIWYKLEATRLVVLWENVGRFSNDCSLQNTFQIMIGTCSDPVIGAGKNVKFAYGDMQWGSSSSDGFSGTPATVGMCNGAFFEQIGRFNPNSNAYDGPFGAVDGINYLDDACITLEGFGPLTLTSCPTDIVVSTDAGVCTAVVEYEVLATSASPVSYSYEFFGATNGGGAGTGSGSTFEKGTTSVVVIASNGCGEVQCSFTVTVNDDEAPVVVLNPAITMWPPNHSYRTITAAEMVASISDNCSSLDLSDVVITSVSSDEPEDAIGNGDGATLSDILIVLNCNSVNLRKERAGGWNGRVYTVNFTVTDDDGNETASSFKVNVPVDIEFPAVVDDGAGNGYTVLSSCVAAPKEDGGRTGIPAGYALEQNYPNPFNPSTTITFSIPQDAPVMLTVFDMYGRRIAVLVDGHLSAGSHSVSFDASGLVSGVYMYTLESGAVKVSKSMQLMK